MTLRRILATVAVLAAGGLLSLPAPAQMLEEADCVYDPGDTCCQCIFGTPTCYETDDSGGTFFCSSTVCPYEEDPCCEGGVRCS